ncbi:hypothetical protein BC629DRAFT_684953 [Irpex lacteus]|nr:hypothetical protein BC629DRAFT_684953 [Irpex lacteus]
MEYYTFLLTMYGSLVGSLLITTPLTGTLVRLRANFNPKSIRLDDEGNVDTQRPATSFFGMFARVKRLEGWSGLYKGSLPLLIEINLLFTFVLYVLKPERVMYGSGFPSIGPLGTLIYLIVALLLNLVSTVFTYRAITAPHPLSYFRPLQSMRTLLSPTERRRPWIIFTTPGLFAALSLRIVYKIIFLALVDTLVIGRSNESQSVKIVFLGPTAVKCLIALLLLGTVLVCPLEVAATKLAIQRNHAGLEYSSLVIEEENRVSGDYGDYSPLEEEVVRLRHGGDPYVGLWDCLNKVIVEEGWTALFRAWWFTALSLYLG